MSAPTTLSLSRLQGLRGMVQAMSESVSSPRVAGAWLDLALPLTHARGACLALFAGEGLRVIESRGFGETPQPMLDASSADFRAALQRKVSIFLDADADPAARWPRLEGGDRAQSLAIVPLVTRRRAIGLVALAFDHPAPFDEEERAFLEVLAHHAALALDRGELHESQDRMVELLHDESQRFRSLVQELDAVFWEADPETFLFSFVSQRAETLLGYPLARWLEPGFWASIIHPEDRSWAVDFCVQCTKEGEDHVFEYRLLDARGESHVVRDVVYVLRGTDGRPAKLRGVMLDVTKERAPSWTRDGRRMPRARSAA